MDGQLDQFVNELKRQLSRLDRRIRSLALLRGLGLIVLVLICLVAMQISLDLILSLGTTARIAMSSLSVTVLVACIWFAMLRRVFHKRTPVELAAIVEESQTRLNERLTSVLELASSQNETSSALMREQLAKETIASLTTFNITDSVPSDRTMRFIMSACIAILIFLTPLLIWPNAYRLLISRSVIPWGNFATVSSLYFEVQPGDETVARGKDLQIIATPHWHTKQPGTVKEVWIEWEDSKGEPNTRRMDLDQESGQYKTQFSRLLSGFQYTISSERSRSQLYSIQIAEPASITETRLTVTPPAYTNSEQQEFTVLPSEISVLEQSRLAISLTFDRPVTEATLQYQLYTSVANPEERPPIEQKEFVLSEDLLTAELELPVHKNSFLFHLEFLSQKGKLQTKTSEHLVKVMPDRAPEIELTIYNQPEFFKPSDSLMIPVKVTDDFSVEELEIHVKKLDEKATIFKVPAEQLGTSNVDHDFKIDLQELQAEQSDIFTYRIRTADNREVPSPNEVWSTPRVFGVDKNAEEQLSAGVISRQQELRDELRKIQQEYKTHRETVEQNIAQLKEPAKKGNLKPEDQQDLLKNSLTERKLAQRLETLANEFLQLPLYQKLAEQAQNVARTDFVKNHDTLKAAADSETRKQATKALETTPKEMSATEEKLGDLARQYEKLVDLENDLLNLDRLAEDTNHLADDLLAFNDKVEESKPQAKAKENGKKQPAGEKAAQSPNTPEKPDPHQKAMSPETEQELAQLQAELKHRQSRLAEDLDNLLDRRPELVDAARNFQLKQLDSLVNQTSQLVEPQKQLAEAIQQQAPVSAGKPPSQEPQQPAEPQAANANNQAQSAAEPGQATPATTPSNSQPAAEASKSKPGQNAQPMNAEQPQSKENQAKPESVRDLQKQQQALAKAAAQFALETAQQFGPESEPTRKVTKLAEESIKAQQEANAGRLHEASQAANRASKVAEEIMKAHKAQNKEQTERDAFLEQAEKMANLQQELAGKMEQASTSEANRQEAVKNSQQDLAEQTKSLAKQLAETSTKLESNPLELKKESQQAGKAQQKTENASQAMEKAIEGLSQENLSQAAEQAQAAAKALQEAAQQAQQASSRKQKDSPVPEKVGNQVTDAAMQLRNAQKQLEQTPEFKAGNPQMAKNDQKTPRDSKSESQQAKPTDQKPSDTSQQKGQAKAESGEKGQSSKEEVAQNSKNQSQQSESGKSSKPSASKEAAESLKRAAESLSQAASELKSKSQKGTDPGKGQQSQTAAKNPAPGKGQGESEGGGARTSVDFTQLQSKLKAMSNRNWGELPGNLDTEILQGSRSRTDPEYARLIKHYFEAIAKSKPDNK